MKKLSEFEKKVRSMKPSEIIQAMITGLKKQHVKVNMSVFGGSELVKNKYVCYGCAATNTICEISGKSFNNENITRTFDRAEVLDTTWDFLEKFENGIDVLRRGHLFQFNEYIKDCKIKCIPDKIINKIMRTTNLHLPILSTTEYKRLLPQYQKLADFLKEKGY